MLITHLGRSYFTVTVITSLTTGGIVRDVVGVAEHHLQRVLAGLQLEGRFRLPLAEVLVIVVHRDGCVA